MTSNVNYIHETNPRKTPQRRKAMQTIVRVSRPTLTPVERARRNETIKRAAVDLVIATETAKRKNGKK